jgi:CRP-like cAMP-binding protein
VPAAEALSLLPPPLRVDLTFSLNRRIVERLPLFAGCSESFIKSVTTSLRTETFLPGDVIAKRGDTAAELYIINSGTCVVLVDDVDNADVNGGSQRNSGGGGGVVDQVLTGGDFYGLALFVMAARRDAALQVGS